MRKHAWHAGSRAKGRTYRIADSQTNDTIRIQKNKHPRSIKLGKHWRRPGLRLKTACPSEIDGLTLDALVWKAGRRHHRLTRPLGCVAAEGLNRDSFRFRGLQSSAMRRALPAMAVRAAMTSMMSAAQSASVLNFGAQLSTACAVKLPMNWNDAATPTASAAQRCGLAMVIPLGESPSGRIGSFEQSLMAFKIPWMAFASVLAAKMESITHANVSVLFGSYPLKEMFLDIGGHVYES
mmetsp:Transcript_114457/g.310819  ORF Transcript_114457/g.310819 Transcript_114457/m.310819 type:complete len:237 (-) Transcript_114457:618-1328(-)